MKKITKQTANFYLDGQLDPVLNQIKDIKQNDDDKYIVLMIRFQDSTNWWSIDNLLFYEKTDFLEQYEREF